MTTKKYKISKQFLIEKYEKEKLSFRDIALLIGCGKTTIEKRIKEFGIVPRTRSETMSYNNPMFHSEARKKVSKWRRNMPPEIRKKYSEAQKKCWEEGKFDNVSVGRCKWFSYIDKSGTTHKCQGKWELAFAKWLDSHGVIFESHVGRISYRDELRQSRNYYPDFLIGFNFIEIKNKHHMSLQRKKFELIFDQNPNCKIVILLGQDLERLGVFQYLN